MSLHTQFTVAPHVNVGSRALPLALGALLLAAAGAKVYATVFDPVWQDSFLTSPRAQTAEIEIEALLGIWLLSGWLKRGAWGVALALFGALACVSCYLALAGQPSCGCFGHVVVSPWLTFSLDVMIVAALLYWRPVRTGGARPSTWLRGLFSTTLGAVAFLILIGGSFLLASDNPTDALARLRGEAITAEPLVSDLGEGVTGEHRSFAVQLCNHSGRPVRIVGGTASCSCLAIGDLPITLLPGEARSVEVRMIFRGEPGLFQHHFQFYTDDDTQRTLIARFRGRVVAAPSS